MKSLKRAKHLAYLRNKSGPVVTEPHKIARTLQEHRSEVSQERGASVQECARYLESLPIPAAVKRSAPLLFKPLSMELVAEALVRQVLGASPGVNGFLIQICSDFPEFFSPLVLQVLQAARKPGLFPES